MREWKIEAREVLEVLVDAYNDNAKAAALFRAADHPASKTNGNRADAIKCVIEQLFVRETDYDIINIESAMGQFNFEYGRMVIL